MDLTSPLKLAAAQISHTMLLMSEEASLSGMLGNHDAQLRTASVDNLSADHCMLPITQL